MPEDVGGTPFPDGWKPDDDDHDRGVSDEEFASVVFDEAFVRAAAVHEPTAVERLLAAAQARAEASEAEAHRARARRPDDGYGGYRGAGGYDPDDEDGDALEADHGFPYGRQVRWHRPVAWMLALVMGIGMVALAFSAVYRGGSAQRQDPAPPPATTGVGQGAGAAPSASADYSRPTVPVLPTAGP